MKNTFYFLPLLLAILFICSPLNGQSKDHKIVYSDDELVIKEIDPDTYLVIHTFPWPANSLVIKFGKGNYLFIDTPYTDEATKKLVDWFQNKDKKVMHITAVNTHFHVDNLGGNGYLKSIGAVIYGSDLTAKILKERGLGTGMLESFNNPSLEKYYNYYKDKALTAPDKLFPIKDGLKLPFPKAD
jgi:metallo-beta-lactamase class B